MDSDQIKKTDFPKARRGGYDTKAVDAHLAEVAKAFVGGVASSSPTAPSVAGSTGERVTRIIEVAETQAAELRADAAKAAQATRDEAEADADTILAGARAEADRLIAEASADAQAQIDSAEQATSRINAEAQRITDEMASLRNRVLGGAAAAPVAEVPIDQIWEPDAVPSPEPVFEPEVGSGVIAEPEAEPIPTVEPPEPTFDELPEPEPEPVVEPEPVHTPVLAVSNGSPTTEELIAQLQGGAGDSAGSEAAPDGIPGGDPARFDPPPVASASVDSSAARLVAMKMALDGSTRDEVGEFLDSEYGVLADRDEVLDAVFDRAG